MYVAPPPRSKRAAGNAGRNLSRIIRKLRLALLQRICRLPLCARQSRRRRKTLGFPVATTNCLAWGEIWGLALRHAGTPAPLPPRRHFSGQFVARVQWRWQALRIIRSACDQILWTCVLYLGCRPRATALRGRGSTDGIWLVRATIRRLAKNSVVTGTETLGGVRPRQAFACGRRQPRQGKVKLRCPHAKTQSTRCATFWLRDATPSARPWPAT